MNDAILMKCGNDLADSAHDSIILRFKETLLHALARNKLHDDFHAFIIHEENFRGVNTNAAGTIKEPSLPTRPSPADTIVKLRNTVALRDSSLENGGATIIHNPVQFRLSPLPYELHDAQGEELFKGNEADGYVRSWEKKKIQRIARARIIRLFQLAEENAGEHPERARRYVELARKIGQRYNVRIPREWKYRFCKKCNSFWIPGETVIIRLKPNPQPHLEYICKACGARRRKVYRGNKENEPEDNK